MSKLVQPPPKFTHPEWTISNQTKYANAEGERSAAERLIAESDRVIDDKTRKTQRDVNKKFGKKIFYFVIKKSIFYLINLIFLRFNYCKTK
jgi:tektin-1